MHMQQQTSHSGIRDNHSRGTVADFFREHITDGISEAYCFATLTTFRDLSQDGVTD